MNRIFFALAIMASLLVQARAAEKPLREMIDSIGSQGGLCVHVGVRDGSFAVQLSQGGKYLVHGLSSSEEVVC